MTTLRRDASINAASNVALAVLGIASGSIVSYQFGPNGRGELGAAQVVGALAAGFGAMGLGDALLYWIASRKAVTQRLVVKASLLAALVAGLLGLVVGALVSGRISSGTRTPFVVFSTLVAATTGFYAVPTGALRGGAKFGTWNLLRIVATSMWVVALIVVSAVGDSIDLIVIGGIYAVSLVAIGVIAILSLRSFLPDLYASANPGVTMRLRPLVVFGLPSAFASAPLLLNARLDQVAVTVTNSTATVGLYVAAAGYCWATVPLGQAISNLTATRVASELDPASRAATLRRLCGLGVSVIGLSTAMAWLFAPLAIRVLNGPGFEGAVPLARILLLGTALQSMTVLLEEGSRGLGQPRYALYAEVTGLSVMAILLFAVSRFGAKATAAASTAGYVTSFLVIVGAVSHYTKVSPGKMLRPSGPGFIRRAAHDSARSLPD